MALLPCAELRTERFLLRAMRVEDAPAFHQAVNESHDHLLPWVDWRDRHSSMQNTVKELRKIQADWYRDESFTMGVFSPDESELLGGTGFHPRGGLLGAGTTEVSMWVFAKHAGKGLGQAVLKALVPWAFQDWGWQRLEWHCDPENHASAAVAKRGGFLREAHLRQNITDCLGRRRDTWIYGLLASDGEVAAEAE